MDWHLYFLFNLQVQADNWSFLHEYQYHGLNRLKDCIMLFNYFFYKLIKFSQLFLNIGDCLAFLRHYNETSFIFVQELFTVFLRRILSKLLWVCRNWESRQGLTMQTWILNIKPKFIKDGQQIKSRWSKYFSCTYVSFKQIVVWYLDDFLIFFFFPGCSGNCCFWYGNW